MSDHIFDAGEPRTRRSVQEAGVGGPITLLLRLEAGLALAAAAIGYRALGGHWPMFALLVLVPDLSMVGYLKNPRLGAALYNAIHTYLSPALLAAIGFAASAPVISLVALIWAAHIGFDRMLGYGLKHASGFGDTHLG